MPPPSQLSIATSSVQRLVKEEASYHKELEKQQARLKNLETNPDEDENAEYQLRQEVFPLPLSYPLVPLYLLPPSLTSLSPLYHPPPQHLSPLTSPSSPRSPCPSYPPLPPLQFTNPHHQKLAIAETLAVFPPLRQRIADSVQKLEDQLEGQENGASAFPEEEIVRAKEVIAGARRVLGDGK
jgi:hypothetical protein